MTLFTPEVTPPVPPTLDPNVDGTALERLVGPGKKFATVEDLAKGKEASDVHIVNLQTEQAGLRTELNTRLSLEEFMEKFDQTSRAPVAPNPPGNQPDGQPDTTKTTGLTEDDVKRLLQTEKQKTLQEQNIDLVKRELQSKWGDIYPTKLREKAKELSVGEDFLNNIAATNPQAFLKIVNPQSEAVVTLDTPPVSTVNIPRNVQTGKKWSDFEKMRRATPQQYWDPSVQNEIHRLVAQHGEGFYKT